MRIRSYKTLLACLVAPATMIGCGSKLQGTYTDSSGAFTLELKSGNQATFTFSGQSGPCTYQSDAHTVNLTCAGQAGALPLTIQSDGSLNGPPGTFLPPLRKK
jgi:hypothetical protein